MGMNGVAAYLRVLREDQGLSREKLAEMIGVAGNTIWRIEDGRQEPGGAILLNLIATLRGSYEDVRRLLSDNDADTKAGELLAQQYLLEAQSIATDPKTAQIAQRLVNDPAFLAALVRAASQPES
jgi:transcriptional regulator with XRE-family HTH domain